ncbi:hypothetical protein OAS82_02490 [Pelagibacteraceae bacterium]|nr:hypothetical protein [Pelagibacteraceae bacterium]
MIKKKSYEISFLKKISYSLIIFVFFIFITEILTRTAISLVTKNQKAFQFGFNKNIKIDINHLIELKINLIDLAQVNDSLKKLNNNNINIDNNNKNNNKLLIWAFGGSTTKGNYCGTNASSWAKELTNLNKNIKSINYGQDGIDSYVSLQILQKNIEANNNIPNFIIWAHKFNEINVIYQGVKKDPNNLFISNKDIKKRKIYYKILITDVTLESNFLFYKVLKNIIITSNRKIIRSFTNQHLNPNLTNNDFAYAAKNFEINTRTAIKISKQIGVKNFYLISLPSTKAYQKKMKNKFFKHYYLTIDNLIEDTGVNFIDLSKNEHFLNKENTLFCDEVHKTYKANKLVANLLQLYIKEFK